jgi:hypothetical protein
VAATLDRKPAEVGVFEALGLMLPQRLSSDAGGRRDRRGRDDLARRGELGSAGSEVNDRAENVAVAHHHVAGRDAGARRRYGGMLSSCEMVMSPLSAPLARQ